MRESSLAPAEISNNSDEDAQVPSKQVQRDTSCIAPCQDKERIPADGRNSQSGPRSPAGLLLFNNLIFAPGRAAPARVDIDVRIKCAGGTRRGCEKER
ncbi:hypothetical protein EVAR_59662_1 [Eumeta japonica]|uniref:Uncharacterized protein n=1 Tax=Eumeta variegata TaxID=151549 RepID=A0A4C1Z3J7_EUMVA|nr:hypothetical protein EVAR_59662_1 [Eumeta japonica]